MASLFSGDPSSPAAWTSAAAERRQQTVDPSIARVLAAQLRSRDAPAAALAAAESLAAASALAVVTGQQAGVFGGPLYTVIKAISAIRLARHVASVVGGPVVPIFWVDCEDHDWDEVRRATVLNRDGDVTTIQLADRAGSDRQPVGRVILGDTIETTLAQLQADLPATEYSSAVIDLLRHTYRPGERMGRAFARLLDALLGAEGLVVFESDDAAAKPLARRVLEREVRHAGEAATLATRGAERLTALGHAPQIVPAEGAVGVFYLDEAGRHPIRRRDGQVWIGEHARSVDDLAAEVAAHPSRFSPNVLLRPLVQDTLFPTVAYVAGPSELTYQAQLGDLYAAHGLPQPLLVSRASVTLLDAAAVRFFERSGLPVESLQAQDESALNRLLEGLLPPALEATCAELEAAVVSRADELRQLAVSVDPTLSGAVDTTIDRVRDTVKTLQAKIVQAAKKKDDTLRRQFSRTRALVFPDGEPQERHMSAVFFLNRYGLDFPTRLQGLVPPVPDTHLLIQP